MPSIIDLQNLYVDDLPAIWSPVQWGLTEVDRIPAVEEQATASLFGGMDAPEAVLRLLLDETGIDPLNKAPSGYDVEQQGAWNGNIITFGPKLAIKLESCERTPTCLELVYDFGKLGKWEIIIESEKVSIARISLVEELRMLSISILIVCQLFDPIAGFEKNPPFYRMQGVIHASS